MPEKVFRRDHLRKNGERIVVVFDVRDTAGKGGAICIFLEGLNPW